MHIQQRETSVAAAREVTELLLQLADERPAVLDALRALLTALAERPRNEHESSGTPATGLALTVEDAPAVKAMALSIIDTHDLSEAGGGCKNTIIEPSVLAMTPIIQPKPLGALSTEAANGLLMLTSKFGGFGTAHGGIGPKGHFQEKFTVTSPLNDQATEAQDLSRLASSRARKLRMIRGSLRTASAFPNADSALSQRMLQDWLAVDSAVKRIAPSALKVCERWYSLVARAFNELAHWFGACEHRVITAGEREQLTTRMRCAALAQKGLLSWLRKEAFPGESAMNVCGVQDLAFRTLRSWSRYTKDGGFQIHLAECLTLHVEITSDEISRIDRDLEKFELQEAPQSTPDRPREASTNGPVEKYDSVAAAIEAAQSDFPMRLVITPRAIDSAECSSFIRPDDVYDAFAAMHSVAIAIFDGSIGSTTPRQALRDRGVMSKPCSAATMKRFDRFYHVEYNNEMLELSEHVTLGCKSARTCISIHWWVDLPRARFIIGHCGKHLPNSLS
ncbi:MAG: hypothetical protein DWI10_00155 [Planctomycetota bacterium]|nr:MAG: hypothetical protein DWI10_00155 [Planctomycetota bacterium]